MREVRGRLRGKGRRPGGGAGHTREGPKRSGLWGRLRAWEEDAGADEQRDLETSYKTPGEASRAEAPKQRRLALRRGHGGSEGEGRLLSGQ